MTSPVLGPTSYGGETYAVDEETAVTSAHIAAEIGPEEPYLDGLDGLIGAVSQNSTPR